jgi:hypothetical protein
MTQQLGQPLGVISVKLSTVYWRKGLLHPTPLLPIDVWCLPRRSVRTAESGSVAARELYKDRCLMMIKFTCNKILRVSAVPGGRAV